MAKYIVRVPITDDQGPYIFRASDNYGQTVAEDALQDYNSARDHDGQPPLKRMPNGTTYDRMYEYEIRGNYGYGHGFECVTSEETRTDAMLRLQEYRENEPGVPFKVVTRGL